MNGTIPRPGSLEKGDGAVLAVPVVVPAVPGMESGRGGNVVLLGGHSAGSVTGGVARARA